MAPPISGPTMRPLFSPFTPDSTSASPMINALQSRRAGHAGPFADAGEELAQRARNCRQQTADLFAEPVENTFGAFRVFHCPVVRLHQPHGLGQP